MVSLFCADITGKDTYVRRNRVTKNKTNGFGKEDKEVFL